MSNPDDITWVLSAEDARGVEIALEVYADKCRQTAVDFMNQPNVQRSQAMARIHSEFVNLRHENGK